MDFTKALKNFIKSYNPKFVITVSTYCEPDAYLLKATAINTCCSMIITYDDLYKDLKGQINKIGRWIIALDDILCMSAD